jgi:dihydroorotate dehydrogenase electron transfer subunit
MKHHVHAPIVKREQLALDLFRLIVEAPEIAASCRAGQFVHLKVAEGDHPLLRRPISIFASDGAARLELVFRVVGVGTKILAGRREGELLDVVGPLGEPFHLLPERRAVLVGGGVGIPPIHALFQEIRQQNLPHRVLVGIQCKSEIGLAGNMPEQAEKCLIATDDGSQGHRGFVTELLAEQLNDNAAVYACGPEPMLRKIIALCNEAGVPAQVSFEQQMGCGFGACIGCSIETGEGYRRVCCEGPVFDARIF